MKRSDQLAGALFRRLGRRLAGLWDDPDSLLRRHGTRLTALLCIVALGRLARQPQVPSQERAELAARFRFTRIPLPDVPGRETRVIRPVHRSLEGISAWISSVGAAVALGDLDGDGLPNDVVRVDPRTDQVTIAPVPGTRDRYLPVRLSPEPLPYDPATMAPMGCLPADVNEDGLMDVVVVYWGRTPVAFLRREDAAMLRGSSVRLNAGNV